MENTHSPLIKKLLHIRDEHLDFAATPTAAAQRLTRWYTQGDREVYKHEYFRRPRLEKHGSTWYGSLIISLVMPSLYGCLHMVGYLPGTGYTIY